ncbi:MAG TPA: hypothetical protein VGH24_08350 [Solirubrobacteraceae bacterium]|jgi:hypothetical protein
MDPSDLYGLPLERFTPERNALAKQLRQEGRRDQAAEVAKLRKPSLAAWAVNQLVRTQKREVGALFKAGDALQKAQADVLAGKGDAASLRKSGDAERAALDRLAGKARGLLSSEGHGLAQAKLEQVSETLHAAAIDEEARTQVRAGCLERELRHVGLGPLGAAGIASRRTEAPRRAKDHGAERRKAARQAESAARRAAELADRTLKSAQQRRDSAVAQLEDAEEALGAALKAADETARLHEQAQAALDEL